MKQKRIIFLLYAFLLSELCGLVGNKANAQQRQLDSLLTELKHNS